MKLFERLEPLPLDDADYGTELPILSDDQPSTCQHCGSRYTKAQFMDLVVPDGLSVWTYESSNVSIAVRKCGTDGCRNMLGRRIA